MRTPSSRAPRQDLFILLLPGLVLTLFCAWNQRLVANGDVMRNVSLVVMLWSTIVVAGAIVRLVGSGRSKASLWMPLGSTLALLAANLLVSALSLSRFGFSTWKPMATTITTEVLTIGWVAALDFVGASSKEQDAPVVVHAPDWDLAPAWLDGSGGAWSRDEFEHCDSVRDDPSATGPWTPLLTADQWERRNRGLDTSKD